MIFVAKLDRLAIGSILRSKLVFLINVRLRERVLVTSFVQRHAEWVGIDNESDQVP